MKARIYRPSKSTTQSGHGKGKQWVVEYETATPREPESLMGWTASGDTLNQVRIKFESLEEAKSFADKNGLEYAIQTPHERKLKPRNYGDNFRYIPEEQ